MSILTYDNIQLPYSNTTTFEQGAGYEDVGGVDVYVTKFDITVQCVLNYNYLSQIGKVLLPAAGQPLSTNPATIMRVIRKRLLTPRKGLSFQCNNNELLPAAQQGIINAGAVIDAVNGPMPQYCNIMDINNTTFLLNYRITAQYADNPTVGASAGPQNNYYINNNGNNALYNRWSETVTIDDCNYSTRTRQGKYMIRSDNVDGLMADQMRSDLAVVSIPNGFLRQSSEYTIAPDGLAIQYRIIDKECFKKPPSPAFKASGTYEEWTEKLGACLFGECNIRLEGSKTTPQADVVDSATGAITNGLLNTAVLIAVQKIQARKVFLSRLDPPIVTGFQLLSVKGKVDLYQNVVEVSARARFPSTAGRYFGSQSIAGMNTATPPMSSNLTTQATTNVSYVPLYKDRGSASLLIRTAGYWDNGLANSVLGPPGQFGTNQAASNQDTTTGSIKVVMTGSNSIGSTGKTPPT